MITFTPLASSSRGNAYLVEAEGVAPLLLEAGLPIRQLREKLNFGLSKLAGCLASHRHMDHCRAIPDLLKVGVDCYVSADTIEALGVANHHRINLLRVGETINIGGWAVLTFPLEHDVPCLGFFIEYAGERLLFIPDTQYIENRFKDINILCIECNHIESLLSQNIVRGTIPGIVGRRIRRNHMGLNKVIDLLRANDLSHCHAIYLMHLSDGNSDEDEMKKNVQEATGIPVYIC